jgi:hypothetical protein
MGTSALGQIMQEMEISQYMLAQQLGLYAYAGVFKGGVLGKLGAQLDAMS